MDRGGEFCTREFNEYCERAGIVRHYTAPYTPQQNGVVEQRNRTVVEMARSVLKQTNMPIKFWGEAVRHVVYVLNKLPTRALSGVTPYEAWKDEKPEVGHLRVFGCIAYVKASDPHIKKLDNRSKTMVHIGKEPGREAYRLYDPEKNKVCVSRDVIFEENRTWPWCQFEEDTTEVTNSFVIINDYKSGKNVERDSNEERNVDRHQALSTPQSNRDEYSADPELTDGSSEPKHYRSLEDIYDNTEEVELHDELLLVGVDEPSCYNQASKNRHWNQAMKAEIDAIERNGTWKLTELPKGQKVIGLKWIFKLKKDANGEIVKHKAKLVAKGYAQEKGVDFDEIFAPVTRLETVRLLLALVAKNE